MAAYAGAWMVLLVAAGFSPGARGEVFVLASGGRVSGQWVNKSTPQATVYQVKTDTGGVVTLAKDQVREVLRQFPVEAEYERLAPTFSDSLEDQWKLAEWCREHNLKTQRTAHLLRVLDHDSNHAGARLGLGFTQVSGQWVIKEEWKKKAGYELYRGHWRLAQEIELLEERSKAEQAEREWIGKLKKLRAALNSDKTYAARDQLLAIRDEHAVPGLLDYLNREPLRPVKELYIDVLGKIASGRALQGLVHVSLNDPDIEIFHDCLDELAEHKSPALVEAYVAALRNENNVRVNRAGMALAKLKDKSAIAPLIIALVTRHKVTLAAGTSSDAVTSTFVNPTGGAPGAPPGGGGAGLSAGASPAKTLTVTVQNPEVLKALVAISQGASFGYDQRAWSRWHAQERARLDNRDVRRD
jgi:hypothetical protein